MTKQKQAELQKFDAGVRAGQRLYRKQKHTPGPPAFTEANRRKVDPSACACRITDGEITYCPLHKSAPELAKMLRQALVVLRAYGVNPYTNLDADDSQIQNVILAALAKAGIEGEG